MTHAADSTLPGGDGAMAGEEERRVVELFIGELATAIMTVSANWPAGKVKLGFGRVLGRHEKAALGGGAGNRHQNEKQ